MHSKTSTLAKEMVELDMPLAVERHSSFLEEDLALSSSTHDSTVDKTLVSSEEKTEPDETTRPSSEADAEELQQQEQERLQQQEEQLAPAPIYVSEDAMDCNYGESLPGPALVVGALLPVDADAPTTAARHFELEEATSPELFESDADDEAESTNTTSTYQNTLEEARVATPASPVKLTSAELILRADRFLLRRVNKYLSGVPPPPNHTISQKDCDDFLAYIKQNRRYFWADPFALDEARGECGEAASQQQQEPNEDKSEDTNTNVTASNENAAVNTIINTSSENAGVNTTVNTISENTAVETTVKASNENATVNTSNENASSENTAVNATTIPSNENAAIETTINAINEYAAIAIDSIINVINENATVNANNENAAVNTTTNTSNEDTAANTTVNTINENATVHTTVNTTVNTSNENTTVNTSNENTTITASSTTEIMNPGSATETVNANSATETVNTNSTNKIFHQTKPGLRNLSTAFDACEQSNSQKANNNNQSLPVDVEFSDTNFSFSISETLYNSSILSASSFMPTNEDSKLNESYDKEMLPTLYYSIDVDKVAALSWEDAYRHKCHEIYYNRNKAIEDFENLRMKLCDRYIGAETQSTCNAFFVKQIPGSARKRGLLAKRNNGQSPGKRLSYLARRRRTFSSANLQGLGLAEKRQLLLNVRKGMIRKGKSPKGKTPRGKSPRGKTPRSSAKKRQLRRLLMEGPSPRKTKIETSKRALFQSPPADRAGPSRSSVAASAASANNNSQKIKRALFPTPKKNEAGDTSQSQSKNLESRKRKSEEDLENPKQKWSKSLSFDCPRNVEGSSSSSWNPVRHSSGNFSSRDTHSSGRIELSETHRKKLLWAVAEALRSNGIGVNHPQFKHYATSLARTVRKFMPDLENRHVPRKPGSTSDRMLKLAKRHVILLIEPKTAV